ncbi:MAG: 16S rRNA (guanine(966)-N(2))-methyltransferase RsmD [Sandaracinaceae bacterium]|nr:MAG: 16S rRNA (guanine(966)-N(2))-methyltransferase RsmD [Sandaracinaceae bacterium]
MRIVGGSLGGRRFSGPPGDGTRPTSERAREAIASALDARGWLEDAIVLDLFAGTGALAFEALSRGAARAFLVEKSRVVAKAIEKSARELGLSDRATVIQADLLAGRGQSRWLASIEPASLVFFDPPYAEIAAVEALLSTLAAEDKLRPGAAVVIEHARRAPPTLPPGFGEVRSYRYGDTAVLVAAWESE